MNVKKNSIYYVNIGVFMLLSVYSLLVCINAFDVKNINMNAGLCAVVAAMVIALLMYLVHATRLAMVLYSTPIAKVTFEIISVLSFLTLSYVIKIYFAGELNIYIIREALVLGSMFMAYIIARMLNQFGFITLLVLTPWPYMIEAYNLGMSDIILMAEIMGVMLVITVVLYFVRHNAKIKNTMMGVFVVAVVAFLLYAMHAKGIQAIQAADYKQYLAVFEEVLVFGDIEKFYFIAVIMAAITGAIRMWIGKGSGNSLVAFAASASFVVMVVYDLGGQYMYMMYLLLAIVASGACGTRPAYMDEEVQLNDNMGGLAVKNKKDSVELSYVDDSELDKMLDELESSKPYGTGGGAFNPIKFAAESEKEDEEIPIELQMYDFGAGSSQEEKPAEVKNESDAKPEVKEEVVEEVVEEAVMEEIAEEVIEEVAEEVAMETVAEEVIEEVAEEVAMETVAEEVIEEVAEEVAMETVAEEVIEEVAEEVAMETVAEEVIEEVAEEAVMETVVEEVIEEVVEEAVMEAVAEEVVGETGNLADSEFAMPVFEMDTVAFANELDKSEVAEDIVEEAGLDTNEQLVVTDESVGSISSTEEFSMPTFEMDAVAFEDVKEIFEDKTEEAVEVVEEVVEDKVEEIQEEVFVATDDAGSIFSTEEFSMPTFEMSSSIEAAQVYEEITSASQETVEEQVEEVVEKIEEQPVVLVENPIFIKNPINFSRTRAYEAQPDEDKDYGFVQSEPTFETMGSFLADNKENSFPQFEATQGAMDDFMSSFVTEEADDVKQENPIEEDPSKNEVKEEEFTAIENITLDSSDDEEEVESVVNEIFEYSSEQTGFIDDIGMPGFMASDFDSNDLFGTISLGSDDEEDDFDESATEEIVVEPETVELGLDLGEEFSFGQAQSLTDLYDYDSTPQTLNFEDLEVEDNESVEDKVDDIIEPADEEVKESYESEKASLEETVSDVYEYEAEPEEEAEYVAPVKNDDVYDWDAADAKYEDEDEEVQEDTVAAANEVKASDSDFFDWNAYDSYEYEEEKEQENAEVVNEVKASDSDFFDWNAYDSYEYEDEKENTDAESVEKENPTVNNNSFEEFVWTDDMVEEVESEESVEEVVVSAVETVVEEAEETATEVVEDIQQAAQEVAVSMEYDYSSDEPDQYEVFQSSGNFVPEVEEVVEETQYEVFQSSGNFVPEVEEVVEETQYEVFQSSGNFVPEVEEVVEETQYEVFQSSGNFVPEVEEVVEETQYEVFQSSGDFVPEVEEVDEEIQYKTYGQEEEEEKSDAKANDKDDNDDFGGFKLDLPDFDLDLPEF